jgi:hypothetical protein
MERGDAMRAVALALALLFVFYYNFDGEFEYYEIIIPADFPVEYRAWVVFSEIFERNEMEFVPQGVRILGTHFAADSGVLVLNLSKEVLDYGGTYFEYRFTQKLFKNAAALPGVRYFSVLVEGQILELPEGAKIYLHFLYGLN